MTFHSPNPLNMWNFKVQSLASYHFNYIEIYISHIKILVYKDFLFFHFHAEDINY